MHVCCVYVRTVVKDYGVDCSYKIDSSLIPLGISYISSSLQKEGCTTEIVYCTPSIFQQGILNYIEKEPQIIAISLMSSFDLSLTIKLVQILRQKFFKAKIIIGGVYVTLEPELILNKIKELDAICIGAGEKAVVEYAKQVETEQYQKTDNLWIKDNNGQLIKCDKVLAIENLDNLAYPDRKGWERWLLEGSDSMQTLCLSRGCLYSCVFCANKELRNKTDNSYFNERTIKNTIEEIDYLVNNYKNIKSIFLSSDSAIGNINDFKNLCKALREYNCKLKNKIGFVTNINFTQNLLKDSEFINLLKEANFKELKFSLESGSYDIRKKLGKPLYSNEQFICFCDLLHKQKIAVMIYTMYCFPYETRETYMETVKCLSKCNPEKYTNTWLIVIDNSISKNITFIDILRYIFFRLFVYIRYKNIVETIILFFSEISIPILELKKCFGSIKNYNKKTNKNI